jgi:hypothetical protein
MKHAIALLVAPALLASACTEVAIPVGTRTDGDYVRVVDVPPIIQRDLDLLFVVDNTDTMENRQRELDYSFRKLVSHLEFAEGGMPDLHIGVVSTDLGAGGYPVPGCGVIGDAGALQSAPRGIACDGPSDAFLRDYASGGGLRDTNYTEASLADAFSCISRLGTDGCAFEQPLEAMKLALDGYTAENQGFLRPGAALGLVILTDEDDCSVYDNQLFDPMLDGSGSVEKFRCFRHGVVCGGDDVRLEGEYTGCEPKRDSDYLADVAGYARFVDQLKFDPEQVVVTGMIGDSSLVEVQVDLDDRPQLVPACTDESGGAAYPAVRLQHFLDSTAQGGQVSSLCGDKPLDALGATARRLRKVLGTRCLDGDLVDVDPETAGLQFDCRVYDLAPDGSTDDLPACTDPYDPERSEVVPCYAIKTGPAECGDFRPHQLALQVWRGAWDAPQPTGTHTIGECLVASPDRQ